MIDNAKELRRDLTVMTRVTEMMDEAGFVEIVTTTNQWPLHAHDGVSKEFAEMVRNNFEEGIQGLRLGLLSGTMLPGELELHLASLCKKERDETLQVYWPL